MIVDRPQDCSLKGKENFILLLPVMSLLAHHAAGWKACYKITHFFLLEPLLPWPFFDRRAARVACSKTSRTPSPDFAEHSR